MKERKPKPLIFTGPMILRLLEHAKTQTRRPCRFPEEPTFRGGWEPTTIGGAGTFYANGTPAPELPAIWNQTTGTTIVCPWLPGDRIWVRETWCGASDDALADDEGKDSRPLGPALEDGRRPWCYYKATDSAVINVNDEDRSPWKSPLHMPRWASRFDFEVVASRAERLKQISYADAVLKGARRFEDIPGPGPKGYEARWSMEYPTHCDHCLGSPQTAFGNFYNVLHAGENWNLKDGSPWDENPLVWVITFKEVPRG